MHGAFVISAFIHLLKYFIHTRSVAIKNGIANIAQQKKQNTENKTNQIDCIYTVVVSLRTLKLQTKFRNELNNWSLFMSFDCLQ